MPKKKKSSKNDFVKNVVSFLEQYKKSLLTVVVVCSLIVSYFAVSFFVLDNSIFDKFRADVIGSVGSEVLEEVDEVMEEDDEKLENPFNDISFEHPEFEEIVALYYKGVISGYPDGTFRPDNKINRAEFLKFVVEATKVDFTLIDKEDLFDCFEDVNGVSKHWFAPFVCSAKHKGWVGGYSDGTFLPSRNIGKAEGLKIILSAFGFSVPEFDTFVVIPYSDISPDDWFLGVAKVGKDNKLISVGEKFNAGWELTRADVARMIYRSMEVKGLL
jgi:hypothetical protein